MAEKKDKHEHNVDTTNLSGFPNTLTDDQKEKLKQLKSEITGKPFAEQCFAHPDGDSFLLRVLRATMKDKHHKREFQVNDALKRVESILQYKTEFSVHEKPDEDLFKQFRKVYPRYAYKDKKLNKVLMFTRMGEFASKGKFSHFTEEQWKKCLGYEMEMTEKMMRELEKESGVENKGYYAIADVKGVSLSALSQRKATVFLANVSGENYPEMIDKVYLINAPWIFEKVYGILKPLLDQHTVSKFEVYSGIPAEFKKEFDVDRLPKEFGGNHEDVVPYPQDSKHFDEKLVNYDVDII